MPEISTELVFIYSLDGKGKPRHSSSNFSPQLKQQVGLEPLCKVGCPKAIQ